MSIVAPKSCSVPDCEQVHSGRGYCAKHFAQANRDGEFTEIAQQVHEESPLDGKCTLPGCENSFLAKGYCRLHYGRVRRTGSPGSSAPLQTPTPVSEDGSCAVENCSLPRYKTRSYCNLHYMRWYRYKSFKEPVKLPNPSWVDITGKRYGTLVALNYNNRTLNWHLLCDCGSTRDAKFNTLERTGSGNTCGDRIIHLRDPAVPSYTLAHQRVKLFKGPAKNFSCSMNCGNSALQWAYDHLDEDEFSVERYSKNPIYYSMKPEHYTPMCIKCHKKFDLANLAHGEFDHRW